MIDIDCHHRGSLAGAMAFAQHLAEKFFPGLYFEVSTNGKGVHGYAILEKKNGQIELVNSLLLKLGHALDEYLMLHPFHVEMVEIKGLSPVVTSHNGRFTGYKSGTLAKFPRAKDRFEELKATTRLSVDDLIDLADRIKGECCSAEIPTVVVEEKKAKRIAAGSIRGTHIDASVLPKYVAFAEELLGHQPLRTSGRSVVTAEDLGIFFILLKFFSLNMNSDGSLPTARFRALWDAMFKKGDIDRAFDFKRFAVMRNYLSSMGLLDWQDERYVYSGGNQKGQAAKWRASEELLQALLQLEEKKKERDTSLTGTTPIDFTQLTQQKLYPKPIQVVSTRKWRDYRPLLRKMGLLAA